MLILTSTYAMVKTHGFWLTTAQIFFDNSDADSALGSDASSSDCTSIASSIRGYRYEYGRRYHAYQAGKYVLPNDEAEQDRLDLHHHVFRLILGGRLYRAPIDPHVQKVFDYGTGTGIWAMDFADEHESAVVTGTDLSPIQPDWVPANCNFLVEDVEGEWSFRRNSFDFIHGRSMCGSVSDFNALYRKSYDCLKPGGWIEVQEYEAWIHKLGDPEGKTIPNITKWQSGIDEASTILGRRFNVALEQKQKVIDAGFINVQDDVYPVCHS
jgi:SAM-dependent methyltransferase